ncbi:MAG: hypothetical protein LBB56_06070 [Chitinispirillales bacterium]|nr:hypothetical protein [Chitinispirillales bacterium]
MFIGIVTTFMVKNTGSQSQVSRGYGTVTTMSSTLRSGMIAAETYLLGEEGATKLFGIIDSTINGLSPKDTFLVGKGNLKTVMGTGQAFSCYIDTLVRQGNKFSARIGVNAGRNEKDKDLRKAKVFGRFGNILFLDIGDNAFFNNANIDIFQDLNITGNVTIMGSLNSGRDVTFGGSSYINGGVSVTGGRPLSFNDDYFVRNGNPKNSGTGERIIDDPGSICRQELPLDISFIPQGVGRTVTPSGGNISSSGTPGGIRYTFSGAVGGGVTAETLDKMLADARGAIPPRLYNGHLVVEVNEDFKFAYNQTFNDSIIFIVNTDWNVGGSLYKSGPNASTLVYVSPDKPVLDANEDTIMVTRKECMRSDGSTYITQESWDNCRDWEGETFVDNVDIPKMAVGKLNQFGLSSGGDFRGLIYVDPDNSKKQDFHWGGSCTIDGAVNIMGNGGTNWESGGSLTINYSPGILSGFGIPRVGSRPAECGGGLQFTNGKPQVDFTPVGYYFY